VRLGHYRGGWPLDQRYFRGGCRVVARPIDCSS
jgi:hypothetical protein